MREDKQSLTDILEELLQDVYVKVRIDSTGERSSLPNIAQAKSKIEEMFGVWVGEDRTKEEMLSCLSTKDESVDVLLAKGAKINQITGYNQRGQEIRERIKNG